MDDKLFSELYAAALAADDKAAYVSEWALSSVWEDGPASEIPPERVDQLEGIWDAAHLSVRDIRAHLGLTQAEFSRRYCIPCRTIGNWETGDRGCPPYLRLLLAESAGLYKRP